MMQLLGIVGILWCGQVVNSQDIPYMPANLTQARDICDASGLVLPRTSDDILRIAQSNINKTWIDLTISPSTWNWITDDDYAVHYNQGCYNFSSLQVERGNITDINTCRESCSGYVYVGVQAISEDNVSCVCTNETDIASAVSEHKCASNCSVISHRQACGNSKLDTFRLLSTRELSLQPTRELTSWNDNPDLDISSLFLCTSLSIKADSSGLSYIRLVPQDCRVELPAICEADNGTVTRMDHVSWFEARQLCHEHGMKSVRVYSPNQINILGLNIMEGWTALRGWTWRSQGREICDTVPSNWSAGYPNISEGECIVVLKDGSWKNVHCDTESTFLCDTSSNTSSPNECTSSIPSTSANSSYLTKMMETSTTSGQLSTTKSDPYTVTASESHTAATSETYTAATPEPHTATTSETFTAATSEPHRAATSETHTAATSEPHTAATSETHSAATSETHTATSSDPNRDTYSNARSPTFSLTEVPHTTSSIDNFTIRDRHSSDTTSGRGVIGLAVGSAIGFLVLAAVVVVVIVFLRKRKQASSGGSSPHTQRDPGDDKSLRPECDQSMDELPIYARPNKDPPTDGVILVVENSLYGSVDLEEDDLQSSRPVAPAISNGRGQGIAVYELAMVSMRDEVNDDSTSGQEAGGLSGSNASMNDQVPDDDPLMIDNSLYDSTDSATDGLPVP